MTQDNTREALAKTFATDPEWLAKIDDGRIVLHFTIEQFLAIRAALSSQPPAPIELPADAAHALWALAEHNALHFGENHSTVILARAALERPSAPSTEGAVG